MAQSIVFRWKSSSAESVQQSALLTEAQENTEDMLDGMLTSLGIQHVRVTFGESGSADSARLR